MGRYDSLEALKARRESWKREIGTRSEFAAFAPRIVRELDAEIADRMQASSERLRP